MKLEKLERNRKKKIAIGVVVFLCLLSALIYTGSRAKYKVTQSIPLVNGTINYKPYDFKMIAMYKANESGGYTEIDAMPTSGYTINEEKSYCTTDNVNKDTTAKLFTNSQGQHVISNLKKNDKCYIWFDKELCSGTACKTIIANTKPTAGATSFSAASTSNEGLKIGMDDDGTTYYFRGAVTNNWVSFAGFYWRIIRINGDGTIRMIYNGTSTTTTGATTQLGTKAFNTTYNNAEYVGIKYTMGSQHGTGTNSTILGTETSTDTTTLNGWYNSKIKGTQYEKFVETNGKFCSDRNVASGHSSYPGTTGTGTTTTVFAPADRLLGTNLSSYKTTQIPTLKCTSASDRLTMPVGLITSDEVVFAGGFGGTANSSYYLYTNKAYWTMSPSYATRASVFAVDSDGNLRYYNVNNTYGVRPVINLAADVKLTGTGTTSDPYKVV